MKAKDFYLGLGRYADRNLPSRRCLVVSGRGPDSRVVCLPGSTGGHPVEARGLLWCDPSRTRVLRTKDCPFSRGALPPVHPEGRRDLLRTSTSGDSCRPIPVDAVTTFFTTRVPFDKTQSNDNSAED